MTAWRGCLSTPSEDTEEVFHWERAQGCPYEGCCDNGLPERHEGKTSWAVIALAQVMSSLRGDAIGSQKENVDNET